MRQARIDRLKAITDKTAGFVLFCACHWPYMLEKAEASHKRAMELESEYKPAIEKAGGFEVVEPKENEFWLAYTYPNQVKYLASVIRENKDPQSIRLMNKAAMASALAMEIY